MNKNEGKVEPIVNGLDNMYITKLFEESNSRVVDVNCKSIYRKTYCEMQCGNS